MKNRLARLLCDQRGQAMVEYSTITFALLIGTGVTAFGVDFPGPGPHQTVTLAQALYSGIQTYVDSYYYSLHLLTP